MQPHRKREVRSFYDELTGRIYDLRYEEEQGEKYDRLLDKIDLHQGQLVLDDGCGTGLLMRRIEGWVVGLDLSAALLFAALFNLKGKANSHLVQADADFKPFRAGVFNTLFSVTLIQNMPNPLDTLREMRRVGRPRSRVIITALKKAFSLDDFTRILGESGLFEVEILKDERIKDWMALTTNDHDKMV
jgi:ubiquinone/menaquinone biosynthesis C-methylase UbiE